MSQSKQIIQAYRIITNDLGIRNLDGTLPRANLAILTDGNGGTYRADICGALVRPGFNEIEITNTGSTISADLSFNKLLFTYGPGMKILKDNIQSNKLVFEAGVTSSFTGVTIPSGNIFADSPTANLNIIPDYGINLRTSTNSLYIGTNPTFTSFQVGQTSLNATTQISTLVLQQGTGILLSNPNQNTINISTDRTNTLNQITLANNSSFTFSNQFNNLNIKSVGPLTVNQTNDTTLTLESNAISQISTSSGQISGVSTLYISTTYGISTSILNNTLIIGSNLPQSLTSISTSVGNLANYSTINFIEGAGIKYSTNMNNLTIQLDKPYFSQISASGTGIISAPNTNMLNFIAGTSIMYSTMNSSLMIDTNDFNAFSVQNQSTISSSNNNKTINLSTSGDISILTDPISNTLTFKVLPNNSYSYSNISVVDPTNLSISTTLAATQNNTSINLIPVEPLTISTNTNSKLLYFGIDKTSLLSSTTSSIQSLTSTLSSFTTNPNFQSVSIRSNPVITYNSSSVDISANTLKTTNLTVSTIGKSATSSFCSFNYNSSIMFVHGTLVAENFATFSDSSLKKFKQPLEISHDALLNLIPWKFDWLADGKPDIGFAAEDVEKIAPELVIMNSNGLRMVDYSRLSVVAISALREMNLRIKCLEEKIDILMNK